MNEFYIKTNRIRRLAICKQDCDFSELIKAGYTNNTQAFIKNVAVSLQPEIAATCGQSLSKFLDTGPATADSILSSLSNNNNNNNII